MKKIFLSIYFIIRFMIMMITNYSFFTIIVRHFYSIRTTLILFLITFCISGIVTVYKIVSQVFIFRYKFDSKEIRIYKGILFKKDFAVRYSDIQNSKWHQPFLFRIFNFYKFTASLPSTGDDSFLEIPILNVREKKNLESYLSPNADGVGQSISNSTSSDNRVFHPVSLRKIVISSLITVNHLYIITIFFYLSDILEYVSIDLFKIMQNIIRHNLKSVIFIFLFLFSLICASIMKQFLNFSKLELKNNTHFVEISNRLLKTESIRINKSDVNGFVITESIGQQFFNLCNVDIIAWNSKVDDNDVKVNNLLPFIEKDKILDSVIELFPQFNDLDNSAVALKKALYYQVLGLIDFGVGVTWSIYSGIKNFYIESVAVLLVCLVVYFGLKLISTNIQRKGQYIYISLGILKRYTYIVGRNQVEWIKTTNVLNKLKYEIVAIKMNNIRKFKKLS